MNHNRLSELLAPNSSWKGGFFVLLKRAFSYIWPITEYALHSKLNGKIDLVWQNGRLCVNQGEANYSFGNLHRIFQYIIHPINLDDTHRICILGFGAGSIYQILRNEKSFRGHITGVEYDNTMIDLFHVAYTDQDEQLELYVGDAADFLQVQEYHRGYDYVFVDLFTGLDHSTLIYNPDFIKGIKLIGQGKVHIYINCIFNPEDRLEKTQLCLQWSEEFDTCVWISVMNGNEILSVK